MVDYTFKTTFKLSDKEKENYLDTLTKKLNCKMSDLKSVSLSLNEKNKVEVQYELKPRKFERIRRINVVR